MWHSIRAKALLLLILLMWLWLAVTSLPLQLLITFAPFFFDKQRLKQWRLDYWVAQDQYINAILLGNPDVTISSRVGWFARQGSQTAQVTESIINWLFFVTTGEKNHCENSYQKNKEHYQFKL